MTTFVYCLSALDRRREHLCGLLAEPLANLILNFTLIPRYGMLGVGIAAMACEVLVSWCLIYFSSGVVIAFPGIDLLRVIGASMLMGVFLHLFRGALAAEILVEVVV